MELPDLFFFADAVRFQPFLDDICFPLNLCCLSAHSDSALTFSVHLVAREFRCMVDVQREAL